MPPCNAAISLYLRKIAHFWIGNISVPLMKPRMGMRRSSEGRDRFNGQETAEITRRQTTDWTAKPLQVASREQSAAWFAYLSTSEFLNWMYPSRTAV